MSLASSSKGNSYYIGTDEANILLDLGISFKKIKDELEYHELLKSIFFDNGEISTSFLLENKIGKFEQMEDGRYALIEKDKVYYDDKYIVDRYNFGK